MLVLFEEDVLRLVGRVLCREGERHEGETLLVEAVEQHVRDTHGLPSAGNLGEEHVKAALDVGLHELACGANWRVVPVAEWCQLASGAIWQVTLGGEFPDTGSWSFPAGP